MLDRLASIVIKIDANKVIIDNSDLKSILLKSKKTKITKFEKSAKGKNLINLSKFQNLGINVGIIKFLSFKAKVIFIWLGQIFIKPWLSNVLI